MKVPAGDLARAYELLKHRGPVGVVAAEHPELRAAIEKTYLCSTPRVYRYYLSEKGAYCYLLAKHDDRRYEQWANPPAPEPD
jgi:hypothetical protein